jgi:Domain of unknown function (DUF4920)
MKFVRAMVMVMMVLALVACSTGEKTAQAELKVQGEEITITEVTPMNDLLMNPTDYLDKVVVVSGKVDGRCMGSGCWISFENGDKEGLIVRTEDDSFIFPEECVDATVTVQGKLVLKTAASGIDEHAEGAVDHVCPNPEYYFYPLGIRIEA